MGDLLEIVDGKAELIDVQLMKSNKSESIKLKQLINKINYINFQGGTVNSVFRHKNYNRSILLDAKPSSCTNNKVSCFLPDLHKLQEKIENYDLVKIYINDGMNSIVINPENVKLRKDRIFFTLPEINLLKPPRKIKRHRAENINAQLIQNGMLFRGHLINFTPESFKIEIPAITLHSIKKINTDASVTVTLINNQQIKYSGECSIIRVGQEKNTITCIVKPGNSHLHRFKSKDHRAYRQQLIPSPCIVFNHPLTGSRVDLSITDISATGFSVEENQRSSTLLPGMIIPELEIVFSTGLKLKCKTQVLFKHVIEDDKKMNTIVNGFTILDMEPFDYIQLLSIVFQARNNNIHLSKDLDLDALWRFFFDTGFIYPAKYNYLKDYKEEIKSTYKKLYINTPSIAGHITYQEKGEILGHVSIVRTYENTWLMQHHAASNSPNNGAGLIVMDQLGRYAYNANKIESIHLDYLLGYYRPENKFPSRVFGGAAASVNNKKGCSLDDFAFLNFQGNPDKIFDDLGSLSLNESNYEDLLDLQAYYEEVSGGLMLDAMDILPDNSGSISVIKAYEKLNFKREIKLYSLKSNKDLLAVFIVDVSNTGLNMSELTNSVKVIIIQPDKLQKEQLEMAVNEIAKKYYNNSTHVLLFPDSYADTNSMDYEKKYRMWVFSIAHSDAYFKYLNKLLRFVKK